MKSIASSPTLTTNISTGKGREGQCMKISPHALFFNEKIIYLQVQSIKYNQIIY